MITLSYPSLRPKNSYGVVTMPPKIGNAFVMGVRSPDLRDRDLAEKRKITPEEVVRRDNIVRKLWIDCKVNAGDYVVPRTVGDREKYGARLLVKGVFRSYHDFSLTEDWPKDDVPYIITLATDDGAILCTTDFFAKASNGGTC